MPNSNPSCTLPSADDSCAFCLGASPPSILTWHNLTTGKSYILNNPGGYTWIDSTNTFLFYCDELTVQITASHEGVSGQVQPCNNSNPINYSFVINGEDVVVSA